MLSSGCGGYEKIAVLKDDFGGAMNYDNPVSWALDSFAMTGRNSFSSPGQIFLSNSCVFPMIKI
jgi:hypothetical protein